MLAILFGFKFDLSATGGGILKLNAAANLEMCMFLCS
jgi:hypothetical protein